MSVIFSDVSAISVSYKNVNNVTDVPKSAKAN